MDVNLLRSRRYGRQIVRLMHVGAVTVGRAFCLQVARLVSTATHCERLAVPWVVKNVTFSNLGGDMQKKIRDINGGEGH